MPTNEAMIRIPEDARDILDKLCAAGFSAYVVGGCVRDSLSGIEPHDWDICTSAFPEEVKHVFSGEHTIDTGLKHGTLTVMRHHVPYEVTTFRTDGEYTDHRHPDGVTFVRDLHEDLSRRDFTVNSMAYHPKTGLSDPFGGQRDLQAGIIRCVGDAQTRFTEDALRIIRALRFASVFDFTIEEGTDAAIRELYPTLSMVAAERIWQEMQKLLCGKAVRRILMAYPEVVTCLIPELKPTVGFDQRTPFHAYTVYEHIVRSVEAVPAVPALRLTMLLHDSGKPESFTIDVHGIGHAHGHQAISKAKAEKVTERLRVDGKTRDTVLTLVEKHDILLTDERSLLLRRLRQMGETRLRQLIEVQRADALAKGPEAPEHVEKVYKERCQALDNLLLEQPCFSLKSLAVNGRDLMAAGIPASPKLGAILEALLADVMEGKLPNEKEALLKEAVQRSGM